MNNTEQKYVDAGGLSLAFGVSLRTITTWRKQGCPCLNINANPARPTLRFSVAEVAAWLRERGKGVEA